MAKHYGKGRQERLDMCQREMRENRVRIAPGNIIGNLLVVRKAYVKRPNTKWVVYCLDCETLSEKWAPNLLNGRTLTCGKDCNTYSFPSERKTYVEKNLPKFDGRKKRESWAGAVVAEFHSTSITEALGFNEGNLNFDLMPGVE